MLLTPHRSSDPSSPLGQSIGPSVVPPYGNGDVVLREATPLTALKMTVRGLLNELRVAVEARVSSLTPSDLPEKHKLVDRLRDVIPGLRQSARLVHMLVSHASFDERKPRSTEARRRIKSWLGSLQMRIPDAPSVCEMQSFSVRIHCLFMDCSPRPLHTSQVSSASRRCSRPSSRRRSSSR